MAGRRRGGMPGQFQRLFGPGTLAGLEEGQLLGRFVDLDDAAAFEAIVARHGPMVLGVCRRRLRDPNDVEDAFQATFLVLIKKAGALRDRNALGPWLHGVAHRVASRARAEADRRARRLRDLGAAGDSALRGSDRNDALAALDEEIERLPEAFRAPIVLCHLEGCSYEEVARRLRWSEGMVRGRLARGRERLRARLSRRGLGPDAAEPSARAMPSLPPAILGSTIKMAMGRALPGTASAAVTTLAEGVLKPMMFVKLKAVVSGVLALGLALSSAMVLSSAQPPPSRQTKAKPISTKAKPAGTKAISGIVRDRAGNPIAGVMIVGTERYREISFTNGVLEDIVKYDGLYAESGLDGRYRFEDVATRRAEPPVKEFGVFAYHEKGYARRSAEELAKSRDLTLEPWGRVEGTATVFGKPLAEVAIRFTLDATDQHSMSYDVYEYQTRTDDQGRFTVEHVPAGVAQASTGTAFGKDAGPYGNISSARRMIKAGEVLTLNIGGAGRPVVGKLRMLEGIPVSLGGGRLVLKTNQKPEPPKMSIDDNGGPRTADHRQRVFLHNLNAYRSPEGLARRLADRIHIVQIHPDGTFRAVEVEPGTYTLSFWIGEDFQHPIATHEVVVPPILERRTDEPLDLGTITIAPPAAE